MAFVRFVPGFTRHPKRIKSGPISSWLWACSVDYCNMFSTDGYLEASAVPSLCASITGSALKRCVDNLVAVGSWVPVPGGYHVHDFLKHNLSKKQSETDQEQARQRYLRHRQKTMRRLGVKAVDNAEDNGNPNAVSDASPNAVSNALPPRQSNSEVTLPAVSQSDIKATTSKGTVAPATDSDLEKKRQDILQTLRRMPS
jgi:hypothetical protein